MFQAILEFAAKKDAIAENTNGIRAQNLEVGGSQIEKGDTEEVQLPDIALKDAKGGSETQTLSDELAECKLTA
ncbi:uncharacterized protein N7458_008468 [Penicillium daleae]|uniref:Uncharacterized protein n=1 Tax=Penicillium daleae TaxID=63821 RepID=A0AAD6G261_9EURO|nr:uncharacterized protein N7458_008468 [Penicillium daleae]KAJ5444596.1 hypothetical protein N7458_008468 [Penicillium daleae]